MAGRPCVKVCVIQASGFQQREKTTSRYLCCVSVLTVHALDTGKSSAVLLQDNANLAEVLVHAGRRMDQESEEEPRRIRPHRRTRSLAASPSVEWERLFSFYEAEPISVHSGRPVGAEDEAIEVEDLRGQPVHLLVSLHQQQRGARGVCLGHAVMGLHMGDIEDRHLELCRPGAGGAGSSGESHQSVHLHLSCTYGIEEGTVRRASFFQEMVVRRQQCKDDASDDPLSEEDVDKGEAPATGGKWGKPLNARFDALALAVQDDSKTSPGDEEPGLLEGKSMPNATASAEVGLLSVSDAKAFAASATGVRRVGEPQRGVFTENLQGKLNISDFDTFHVESGVDLGQSGRSTHTKHSTQYSEHSISIQNEMPIKSVTECMIDLARFPINGTDRQKIELLDSNFKANGKNADEERTPNRWARGEHTTKEAVDHGWIVQQRIGELEKLTVDVDNTMRKVEARQGEEWVLRRQLQVLQRKVVEDAVRLDEAKRNQQELESILSDLSVQRSEDYEGVLTNADGWEGKRSLLSVTGDSKDEMLYRLKEELSEQLESNKKLNRKLKTSITEASGLRENLAQM